MKVAVGSKNPVKIASVKEAFEAVWPEEAWEFEGVDIASGVADQPMSDEESIRGARTRAAGALEATGADFGVGLEGGLQLSGGKWFDCGWIVVVDADGLEGIGSTVKMVVPEKIMELIRDGKELGHACDEVFGLTNSKQGQGHFGLMTNNVITRTSGYAQGVVSALAAFIHRESRIF